MVSKLHDILKPFMLRRVKSEVESSLPGKMEVILYAPMTPHQQQLNKQLLDNTLHVRRPAPPLPKPPEAPFSHPLLCSDACAVQAPPGPSVLCCRLQPKRAQPSSLSPLLSLTHSLPAHILENGGFLLENVMSQCLPLPFVALVVYVEFGSDVNWRAPLQEKLRNGSNGASQGVARLQNMLMQMRKVIPPVPDTPPPAPPALLLSPPWSGTRATRATGWCPPLAGRPIRLPLSLLLTHVQLLVPRTTLQLDEASTPSVLLMKNRPCMHDRVQKPGKSGEPFRRMWQHK